MAESKIQNVEQLKKMMTIKWVPAISIATMTINKMKNNGVSKQMMTVKFDFLLTLKITPSCFT